MRTLEQAKRVIRIVFAFALLVVGVAMLVLPGPGIVVIVVALAILSAEFVWARILLDHMKLGVRRARQAASRFLRFARELSWVSKRRARQAWWRR